MRLRLKRIISGSLALCLATLVILSAPLEARAAAQDLLATTSNAEPIEVEREPIISIEEPEYLEDDDLEEIFGAGANSIEDFDPSNIEPLSPEAIQALQAYTSNLVDESDQEASQEYDSDISPQILDPATATAAMTCMLLYILWYCYSSGLKSTSVDSLVNFLSKMDSGSYDTFVDGVKKRIYVTQTMVSLFVDKLKNSATSSGYSVTLTDDDKKVLICALNQASGVSVTDLDPSSVNIKSLNDYKYYYYMTVGLASRGKSFYVLYTPQKVAYATVEDTYTYFDTNTGKYRFYNYIAPAKDPFQEMNYHVGKYTLDSSSGYYEYDMGSDYTASSLYSAWCVQFTSLPFLVIHKPENDTLRDNFQKAFLSKSTTLLDNDLRARMVTTKDILNLETVTGAADLTPYLNSEKNIYATVSGLNAAAGSVLDTKTDTGTDTKPGTNTGTDTKPGTTTADLSGVMTELQTLRGIITTLQTNISTMQTTMTSVLAELQEIKAALKDISAGVSTKVDLSPVVDVLEDVQADVIDIRDTIEVLRAEVAYQQELITDIKTNVATIPALIDDVRAEVKAIPGVIDGVRADVKVLTDTLLDVYPALDTMTGTITDTGAAVGSKVDALPGAITDTMTGAIVTDLTQAQTSKDWGMTSPFFDRFPFSIPWDVAGCFSLLVADPVKPIWKIPFKIDNPAIKVDEEVVIDLSGDEWQGPIKVVRAFILIAFIAALAVITRALIKG